MASIDAFFSTDPEGLKISEKFLLGDLMRFLVQEIKLMPMGWGVLPEAKQKEVLDRMTDRVTDAVKQTVNHIASNNRPHLLCELESVLFKDGIKAVLGIGRHQDDRHMLADAQGGTVLLVLPQVDKHLGGDRPKPEPDQPDLIGGVKA